MRILIDTNVLCRLAQKGHSFHAAAEKAVLKIRSDRHELCLVPQVLYEYWVVVTRPASDNGLGMSVDDADKAIGHWIDLFTLFRDERGVFPIWRELVRQRDVLGKTAHDARLIAAMKRHQMDGLLTFNAADFYRFDEVNVLDVQEVVTS
jgi:predicted nucleic acid-binding protein